MKEDRRKYTRYEIGNAVSVDSEGVFQIIDISRGGFRFKCPPNTVISETWVTDIINSFIPLERVPVRKIWVSIHGNENYDQPYLIMVGAKFGRFEKEEKLKLINLLESISFAQMSKDSQYI
ncbi:PilZ domain-containing protein [Thermodesulfobacteriota bacterium]